MKIVIISPHPDDDAIGCGGIMRKYIEEGDEVHSIFLTSGELGGRPEGVSDQQHIETREHEAKQAASVLGLTSVQFLHGKDQGLVEDTEISYKFVDALREIGEINALYVTHAEESHPDHVKANELVRSLRTLNLPIHAVFSYEVWSPMQNFNTIIDITPYVGLKRAAIRAHKSQWQNAFEEAALALNHYRGILHGPGIMYAEIFEKW